tara:strand:- start:49 stop:480 length:432 start_codon:yes stop_codon:yes gene_type:complete
LVCIRCSIKEPEGKFLDRAALLQLDKAEADIGLRNAFAERLVRAQKILLCSGRQYPGRVEDEGERGWFKREHGLGEWKAESAPRAEFRYFTALRFTARAEGLALELWEGKSFWVFPVELREHLHWSRGAIYRTLIFTKNKCLT